MTKVFDVFSDKPSVEVESCQGLYINTTDGRTLLDVSAGDTSHMILGWQHEDINRAMANQMQRFSHLDYKAWRDPNLFELSALLTKGGTLDLDTVYFSGNSGAEACEAAMKISHLVHKASGYRNKTQFIGRYQSYHGASSDAMSFTDRPNLQINRPFFPDNKLFVSEHNPLRHKLPGESDSDYVKRNLDEIEQVIVDTGPENIAAFLGETMMGGLVGDVPPLPGYWRGVRTLCDTYDIHLILDEVYCGTGTSGKYHCFEYDDVTPDFLMLSKTLAAGYAPLSAVLTRANYESLIHEQFGGRLAHSSTMQGYSLGVAASIAVQKIVSSADFQDKVCRKGHYLQSRFNESLSHLPTFKEVRGRGLRLSVEHNTRDNESFSNFIYEKMLENDIYINAKWHRTSFTPALNISEAQLNLVADIFTDAFKRATDKFE